MRPYAETEPVHPVCNFDREERLCLVKSTAGVAQEFNATRPIGLEFEACSAPGVYEPRDTAEGVVAARLSPSIRCLLLTFLLAFENRSLREPLRRRRLCRMIVATRFIAQETRRPTRGLLELTSPNAKEFWLLSTGSDVLPAGRRFAGYSRRG